MIDKRQQGRFNMDDLVRLLSEKSFQEQAQEDLLKSFQELDDDADGYIPKREMEKLLKTLGEGLSDEELKTFMDLAVDKDAPNPNSINIRKITEILLPKLESTNMLASMKNPASSGAASNGPVRGASTQL